MLEFISEYLYGVFASFTLYLILSLFVTMWLLFLFPIFDDFRHKPKPLKNEESFEKENESKYFQGEGKEIKGNSQKRTTLVTLD